MLNTAALTLRATFDGPCCCAAYRRPARAWPRNRGWVCHDALRMECFCCAPSDGRVCHAEADHLLAARPASITAFLSSDVAAAVAHPLEWVYTRRQRDSQSTRTTMHVIPASPRVESIAGSCRKSTCKTAGVHSDHHQGVSRFLAKNAAHACSANAWLHSVRNPACAVHPGY